MIIVRSGKSKSCNGSEKRAYNFEECCRTLDSGHRSGFPTMIIDDEGDQASMNISKKHESTIHERIRDLRERLEKECLISVTATPYANFRLDPEKGTYTPQFSNTNSWR